MFTIISCFCAFVSVDFLDTILSVNLTFLISIKWSIHFFVLSSIFCDISQIKYLIFLFIVNVAFLEGRNFLFFGFLKVYYIEGII